MLHVECSEPNLAVERLTEIASLDSVRLSPVLMQSLFEAASGVAVCLKQWDEAVHCLVVAQSLAESNCLQRDPADDDFVARQIAAVTRQVGDRQIRLSTLELQAKGVESGDVLFRLQIWIDEQKARSPCEATERSTDTRGAAAPFTEA
jgi:hypothetical protein